jgi:hypothetical protein
MSGIVTEGRTLTIPVNGVYFDQIACRAKDEEYRLTTPYWSRRLMFRDYASIVLTRGYPTGGGIEGVTRLTRAWRGYERKMITHPHFGPEPVEVFAIDVSLPLANTPSGLDAEGMKDV